MLLIKPPGKGAVIIAPQEGLLNCKGVNCKVITRALGSNVGFGLGQHVIQVVFLKVKQSSSSDEELEESVGQSGSVGAGQPHPPLPLPPPASQGD